MKTCVAVIPAQVRPLGDPGDLRQQGLCMCWCWVVPLSLSFSLSISLPPLLSPPRTWALLLPLLTPGPPEVCIPPHTLS